MKRAALILTAIIAGAGTATANGLTSDNGLAAKGKQIIEANCARCHAVGTDDASTLAEAPPFRNLASKWPVENLEESLAEGIVTGHRDMPVFQFEPDQISAIIEYLHAISVVQRQ